MDIKECRVIEEHLLIKLKKKSVKCIEVIESQSITSND